MMREGGGSKERGGSLVPDLLMLPMSFVSHGHRQNLVSYWSSFLNLPITGVMDFSCLIRLIFWVQTTFYLHFLDLLWTDSHVLVIFEVFGL